ncbi:S1/P1 nuclease [Thalassotalea sp. Y01]|uniref:S1/P1 nuclease n=1 Tax=Thalassotalea sp. Y01 TaxID=2729613 RepID=UPI00145C89AC|nr:S1/P1 nuclease [Thalassotalea sp. Y01]NMP15993.1 S1/P1 nuclease [Thalassotalea sp. Y01]
MVNIVLSSSYMRQLFALLLISLSFNTLALGKDGHVLVCESTWQQLAQDDRQKIRAILKTVPSKEKQRINRYLNLPSQQALTFANGCNWPDAIKRDKLYDQYKPWHYINVKRNHTRVSKDSCSANKPCITYAIHTHLQHLKAAFNEQQLWQALFFLGHWLGDIHQPLHVSFSSDRGGNQVKTSSFYRHCDNLHAVWDYCLLDGKSNKKWLQIMQQKMPDYSTEQAIDITRWANESLQISRLPTTGYCQLKGELCQSLSHPTVIDPLYVKTNQQILLQQMSKAAQRLKIILKKYL